MRWSVLRNLRFPNALVVWQQQEAIMAAKKATKKTTARGRKQDRARVAGGQD